MIRILPSRKLLLLPMAMGLLGLIALMLIGLSVFIKGILLIMLLAYVFFQAIALIQLQPRALVGFALPKHAKDPWQLQLKKGQVLPASLLGSTRITTKVIILHFKVEQSTTRYYQIILPDMIGKQNFHDLLVHLKIS